MLVSSLATAVLVPEAAIELTLPLRGRPGIVSLAEKFLNAETGEAARLRLERRLRSRGVVGSCAVEVVILGGCKSPEVALASGGTGVVFLSSSTSASDIMGDDGAALSS